MSDEQNKTPAVITVNERGQMVARDNAELIRLIRQFMKGQAFPKTLDTEEKVVAAWQMAASLALPPAVAIQNMAVINGTVAIWGQLPRALAEKTGELEYLRQISIDSDQNEINLANKNLKAEVWAVVVQIKRKGRRENEYFFSLDDAKKARLTSKSGPWQDYPRIMLARRTVAQAIKFEFPDALMGTAVAEYDLHAAPDLNQPKDVTPAKNGGSIETEFSEVLSGAIERDAGVRADDQPAGREGVHGPRGVQDRDVQTGGEGLQE